MKFRSASSKILLLRDDKRYILQPNLHIDRYVTLFAEGDEEGFDFFFSEYYAALCLFAFTRVQNREVAEELASDAFIKTWQHHSQFTSAAGIRAYLYQVLRNDCTKYLQRNASLASKEKQFIAALPPTNAAAPDESIIKAETARLLHNGIKTLAPECRKVFTLLFIEGKSIGETAEALHLSRSTVKTQKARGLEILRKKIAL